MLAHILANFVRGFWARPPEREMENIEQSFRIINNSGVNCMLNRRRHGGFMGIIYSYKVKEFVI